MVIAAGWQVADALFARGGLTQVYSRPQDRRCRARPARGITGKAECGASPASTLRWSLPQGRRLRCVVRAGMARRRCTRDRGTVGAGLARHGASPGRPNAGQAPHLRRDGDCRREIGCRGAVRAGMARRRCSHAPRYRRCRARPARASTPRWPLPQGDCRCVVRAGAGAGAGITGKAECGASPASTLRWPLPQGRRFAMRCSRGVA